jgi:hypothetical protein
MASYYGTASISTDGTLLWRRPLEDEHRALVTSSNPYLVVDVLGLQPASRTEKPQRQIDINGTPRHCEAAGDEFDVYSSQVHGIWDDLNVDCQRCSARSGRFIEGGDGEGHHISNATPLNIDGLSAFHIG